MKKILLIITILASSLCYSTEIIQLAEYPRLIHYYRFVNQKIFLFTNTIKRDLLKEIKNIIRLLKIANQRYSQEDVD